MTQRQSPEFHNDNKIIDTLHYYNDRKYDKPLASAKPLQYELLTMMIYSLAMSTIGSVLYFYLVSESPFAIFIFSVKMNFYVTIFLVFFRVLAPQIDVINYFKNVMFQFNHDQLKFKGFTNGRNISSLNFEYPTIKQVEFHFDKPANIKRLSRAQLLKHAKKPNKQQDGFIRIILRNGQSVDLILIDSLYSQQEIIEIEQQFNNRGVKVKKKPLNSNFNINNNSNNYQSNNYQSNKNKSNNYQTSIDINRASSGEIKYPGSSKLSLNIMLSRHYSVLKLMSISLLLSISQTIITCISISESWFNTQHKNEFLINPDTLNPLLRYNNDLLIIALGIFLLSLFSFSVLLYLLKLLKQNGFKNRYITFNNDGLCYYLPPNNSHNEFGYIDFSQIKSVNFAPIIRSYAIFKAHNQDDIKKMGKILFEGAHGVLSIKLKSNHTHHFTYMPLLFSREDIKKILAHFKDNHIQVNKLRLNDKSSALTAQGKFSRYLNW
ncbi:MAG: hypothetical protein HRU38_19330 [Saccharospirillaceae bacterium]|nr:hypothetical protein [Pseudomonadales bacterium]NRB80789.1 hypothetical protein [Saccharospirillaceae bacterium]